MISLGKATAEPGTPIEEVIARLEDEGIDYKFGEMKVGSAIKKDVLIARGRSISFEPYNPVIGLELKRSGIRLQNWDRSELRWQDLSLRRRLLLHR
jgi:hypothetical protein